jgi:hypothetical protein
MLKVNIEGLTEEEVSVVVEAAYYAMRIHYEGLADHLDLADHTLKPIVERFIELADYE